ncbi:MAG: CYTH domain-containing protein [Gammaproteobacteria bacterium]|nr:CYTH domain-containing protein [Gammaproteobacteria bacterium]MDP2142116.1 CYTH domain-containing protein [Gammaproteobacteria bacterium]MDP2348276.1 CYTH domain-containing protein [Gammaproteobacteria bacterium]
MAIEIERKFLVRTDRLPPLPVGTRICQAYIPTLNRTTVRIRLSGSQAFIALKGPSIGVSRSEFEYPIPLVDAQQMIDQFCSGGTIDKVRHEILHEGMLWELDIFSGENSGLIVAEIELTDEAQAFALPDWVDCEVSADPRYSNYELMQNPYSRWVIETAAIE